METATMGKVIVTATIHNLDDLYSARKGLITPDQVRRVEVKDALVDTGCTSLGIPRRLIAQLGLRPVRTQPTRTVGGRVTLNIYEVVRLTVQGRECSLEPFELSDDNPVLIGQVPLELLDWVVDMQGQKLIGNPEHGGHHMADFFGVYD